MSEDSPDRRESRGGFRSQSRCDSTLDGGSLTGDEVSRARRTAPDAPTTSGAGPGERWKYVTERGRIPETRSARPRGDWVIERSRYPRRGPARDRRGCRLDWEDGLLGATRSEVGPETRLRSRSPSQSRPFCRRDWSPRRQRRWSNEGEVKSEGVSSSTYLTD